MAVVAMLFLQKGESMTDALYIHVPFCRKKCGYCDFLSFTGKNEEEIGKYVEYLKREINLYPDTEYDTVYFGGGTPSILKVEHFYSILGSVKLSKGAEVTVEINPATVDYEKLHSLREAGVNRLSIGVQSFDDGRLEVLGRIHSSLEAIQAFNDARMAGFDNISLDLIFATPGQTMDELDKDLQILNELSPEHISIYSLIWEEGTKFWDLLENKKLSICDEELEEKMYTYIIEKLNDFGYVHYEVSNFSKPGMESRHNSKYWLNKEYAGVGLGASGYIDGVRYRNFDELEAYYGRIDSGKPPVMEEERLDEKMVAEYSCILGLRLLKTGIMPKEKKQQEKCAELAEQGYLEKKAGGEYILSRKGLFFANDVFEQFLD